MFSARDPQSGVVYDGESLTALQVPTTTHPTQFVCVDLACSSTLVWKQGHGGRRPHWSHKSKSASCAGSAMSQEHLAMQNAVTRWKCATVASKEVKIDVPASPRRSRPTRRADVGIRVQDPSGAVLKLVVECQNSPSSRQHEEERITDLNLAGYPVLLAVSPKWIVDVGGGMAKVHYWVRDWAHRHGRRQIAVLDHELWWVKFTGTKALTSTKTHPVERVRIDFGKTDASGQWQLGLCADTTRPSSKGNPSLCIAAPAWLHRSETGSFRGLPHPIQPSRVARPSYLGSRGWDLFPTSDIIRGGF